MPTYYEDIAVGDTWSVGSYTISAAEIIEFAEQFDPQPFHTDREAAKDSMFGELVASGLHTLSLSARLFVTKFVDRENGLANMGGLGMDQLRWPNPVRPGDTLTLKIEAVEKTKSESHDGRGYIEFDRTVVSNGTTAVLTYHSHNVVERQRG